MDIENSASYKKTIGTRIADIRKSLGLSMEEFGKRMDPKASKGAVSNWENGYNLPNNNRLKKIAELGNTTVRKLLEPEYFIEEGKYLGLVIKELRNEAKMTQRELSDITGLSVRKISEQENGLVFLSENDITLYSKAFRMTQKDIISKIQKYNDNTSSYTPASVFFGKLVQEKRIEENLSIEDFSKIMNVSPSDVRKLEKGLLGNLSINFIYETQKRFNISPRHIFEILDTIETNEEYLERTRMQNEINNLMQDLNYEETKQIYEKIITFFDN